MKKTILPDIAFYACDTIRTRAYLQMVDQAGFKFSHIILVKSSKNMIRPGQVLTRSYAQPKKVIWFNGYSFDPRYDNEKFLVDTSQSYEIFQEFDPQSHNIWNKIANRLEIVILFSGFGGMILNNNFLDLEKKFLHVHGGRLPSFGGSTTNYYDYLLNKQIGATAIFLTEKIDEGPVLKCMNFSKKIDMEDFDDCIDPMTRGIVLIETIKDYMRLDEWPQDVNLQKSEDRGFYYIIHPVLKHLAILKK